MSLVAQLQAMGFDASQANAALSSCDHDLETAISMLLSGATDHSAAAKRTIDVDEAPMDRLHSHSQFLKIKRLLQTDLTTPFDPASLLPHIRKLADNSPEIPQLISHDKACGVEFVHLLTAEPGQEGAPTSKRSAIFASSDEVEVLQTANAKRRKETETITGPNSISFEIKLTKSEKAAVDEMILMGFCQNKVLEAFIACDKNKEAALNYLLTNF